MKSGVATRGRNLVGSNLDVAALELETSVGEWVAPPLELARDRSPRGRASATLDRDGEPRRGFVATRVGRGTNDPRATAVDFRAHYSFPGRDVFADAMGTLTGTCRQELAETAAAVPS